MKKINILSLIISYPEKDHLKKIFLHIRSLTSFLACPRFKIISSKEKFTNCHNCLHRIASIRSISFSKKVFPPTLLMLGLLSRVINKSPLVSTRNMAKLMNRGKIVWMDCEMTGEYKEIQ